MVASNPLFVGSWSLQKLNATILNDIWPELIFFTGVAVVVTLVSEFVHNLGISNALLTVLGTILGLVISFRTSSAYDRYWEGRKLWSTILLASRSLASLFWMHIPTDRPDKTPKLLEPPKTPKKLPRDTPSSQQRPTQLGLGIDVTAESPHRSEADKKAERQLRALIEKKTMVGLVQAFSVAVKHFLRDEPGVYYDDLYPLISFLPRYAPAASGGQLLSAIFATSPSLDSPVMQRFRSTSVTSRSTVRSRMSGNGNAPVVRGADIEKGDIDLLPAENPPRVRIYDYLPFLLIFKPVVSFVRQLAFYVKLRSDPRLDYDDRDAFGKKRRQERLEGNVPLEICLFLSSYIAWVSKEGLIPLPLYATMLTTLNQLQDCLTSLERVATSPIPFAYQAHLRIFTWLYLLFLPFQMYPAFGYLTIPATTLTTFLVVGLVEIGHEIENPFNYDDNDLDLNQFCKQIARDLTEITAHLPPEPWDYMFNANNYPFSPADDRAANEILDAASTKHGESALNDARAHLFKNYADLQPLLP